MNIKCIVIVQCEQVFERCSGWHCTRNFYDGTGGFSNRNYGSEVKYISFSCGGCNGRGVSSRLSNFKRRSGFDTDDVAVHLASCMVTDNHHGPRCPFVDSMKTMIRRLGYNHIVEGTHISKTTEARRKTGVYKTFKPGKE